MGAGTPPGRPALPEASCAPNLPATAPARRVPVGPGPPADYGLTVVSYLNWPFSILRMTAGFTGSPLPS
ncbi:hypothetical protein JCM13210_15810 [Thermaerobacter litoralis]